MAGTIASVVANQATRYIAMRAGVAINETMLATADDFMPLALRYKGHVSQGKITPENDRALDELIAKLGI